MELKGRFIISRKDQVSQVDDVYIENEGLTIGRLIGNDLVLNHRAVSRTHAGIKRVHDEYWLFNLSESNGTMLNGQLVARVALADGDVVQIGPYLLRINYGDGTGRQVSAGAPEIPALRITVEMELEVQPLVGRATQPLQPGGPGAGEATVLVSIPRLFDKEGKPIGAAKRPGMTGLLTGLLPALDDQALNAFWEKRKREAGKVGEKTPLHPRVGKKSGKSQFGWRPTLDLKNMHKSPYFIWGLLIIAGLAGAALVIPQRAYSPGDLSSSHSSDKLPSRGFALEANGGSCSSCHYRTTSINENCTECHTTSSFRPIIYDKHQTERMGCVDCHSEHRGPNVHAALVAYGICSSCHNNTYTIRYGDRAGRILGIPHGGTVGYPLVDHKWTWKGLSAAQWKARGLPEALGGYSIKDQFHLVHQVGQMQSRMRCTDCHTAGVPAQNATDDSPRAECAKCHALSLQGGAAARLQANCSTCHQQHGQSMDTAALITATAADTNNNIKKYVASLNAPVVPGPEEEPGPARPPGGARAMRQGDESLSTDALSSVGGVPWYGWLAVAAAIPVLGLVVLVADSFRAKQSVGAALAAESTTGRISLAFQTSPLEGPSYPHPVINAELCIGCHACVEACPHDVLAIVDGIASPVALDQCMEDTSCQVECPTNPKACIVVNTKKKIPPRKVPVRNQRFMTNVDGIYLIGDVSGVPLIKNAVNEGAQVLDCVLEDLNRDRKANGADYDVAIIGMGPAGLSAAVLAKQRGLRVLALEQDTVASTIQNYPAGKYVFFKPDTVVGKGGIPIPGAGEIKEDILRAWDQKIKAAELDIHEQESCVDIKRGENVFVVVTEKGKARQPASYSADAVVLAIGNRGAPMKLGVTGEDLKLSFPPDPRALMHCMSCGGPRKEGQRFCTRCGVEFDDMNLSRRLDDKVKYKLQDPDDYSGKKCIIVGAGNSAIEAAVDLCGLKRDEKGGISFVRDNEVTLVVRSDFKGDLKLGNKMNVYDCMDAGKIKVYFRTGIKEISENAVVLQDIGSKEEKGRIPNDYVFALIGAEKPIRFLQSLGIKIAG